MKSTSGTIPQKLDAIIEEFQFCEGREKLELLIQYAQNLAPLPAWLVDHRDHMESVPECMTPVFVQAESDNGKMFFHFDVPAESPMVRGFAAFMKQGIDGSTPEEVLQIPGDFYQDMDLQSVLTHQRLNGLSAILAHMKQIAVKSLETKEEAQL